MVLLCLSLLLGRWVALGQAPPSSPLNSFQDRCTALFDQDQVDRAREVLDSALKAAHRNPDLERLVRINLAKCARFKGEVNKADSILATVVVDSSSSPAMLLFALRNEEARNQKALQRLERALPLAQAALRAATSGGLVREEVDAMVLIAEIHRHTSSYDKVLAMLIEAEKKADAMAYDRGLCNIDINWGNVLYYQKRCTDAMDRYRKAFDRGRQAGLPLVSRLALQNMASAKACLDDPRSAIGIYLLVLRESEVLGARILQARILANIGDTYTDLRMYDSSMYYIQRSMELRAELGDSSGIGHGHLFMAESLSAMGDGERALAECVRAGTIARGIGDLELEVEATGFKAEVLERAGRPEQALEAMKAYLALKDSLDSIKEGERINDLEVRYETEKKEQTIHVQDLELKNRQALLDRKRAQQRYLAAALLLLVVVGGLLIRNLRHQRKLAEQRRTIAEQQVDETLRNQELKLVTAMVEGQESERQRIAKELHDRLGSMLSAVKLRFSALEGWVTGQVKEQQEQFSVLFQLLDSAVTEVRRVSHDMARTTVGEFGLRHALEELRDAIAVPGRMEVELDLFGLERRLDPRIEIALFRIVQELVSNALKHSACTHLTIQLVRNNGMLNAIVSDNGRGFDPEQVSDGLGLRSVRERAAELSGTVSVDSKPGSGTTITVDVPLS